MLVVSSRREERKHAGHGLGQTSLMAVREGERQVMLGAMVMLKEAVDQVK